MTVGLGSPEWMESKARSFTGFDLLKIKLNRKDVMERMRAVRAGAPKADFIVDMNEDWTLDELKTYAPQLKEIGVKMIEQPLKRGKDSELISYASPAPLGADESCYDRSDLDGATMLANDVTPSLRLENGLIYPYDKSLWG
jgi:L-alanine-DL-glutamate epimerase-like enolase superfamily enzyme